MEKSVSRYALSRDNGTSDNGTAPAYAGNTTDVLSQTVEIWKYGNGTESDPTPDQLNGTMLQEIEALADGDRYYITHQTIQKQAIIQPLTSTSVYIDPAITYASQYDTINVNVNVSNVASLAGWQFELSWANSKLNCTGVSITDPSGWNGSLACATLLNNTYSGTTGIYFNAKAMESGNSFTGTTTLATVTFYVLGYNVNATLTLTDVYLGDPSGNNIATSTTNGLVDIGNGQ